MAKQEISVSRTFVHRTHGTVCDTLAFTAPAGEYVLDGQPLEDDAVQFLLNFALQTFQDAYAGADSLDECQKAFSTKLDRVKANEMGTRGAGVDPITTEIRILVYAAIRKSKDAKTKKVYEKLKVMKSDARADALDAIFAKQSDDGKAAITAKAESEHARKEEVRKAKNAAMADLGVISI